MRRREYHILPPEIWMKVAWRNWYSTYDVWESVFYSFERLLKIQPSRIIFFFSYFGMPLYWGPMGSSTWLFLSLFLVRVHLALP